MPAPKKKPVYDPSGERAMSDSDKLRKALREREALHNRIYGNLEYMKSGVVVKKTAGGGKRTRTTK